MKAKRILAGVCASVMLATAAVPVVAADGNVTVTVGKATVKAGEAFSVTVDLDIPATGINGCDFGIQYDASVISITGVEKGALAVEDTDKIEGINSLETNKDSGLVSVIYAVSGTKATGKGTFITLKGTAAAGAAGKKSDLKIVAIDRTAKPSGTDKNTEVIFGYLQDDNKTFVNYTPTLVDGLVEVTADTTTPTDAPTQAPTDAPTQAPTDAPTQAPTDAPTQAPTQAPTDAPTQAPTDAPTQAPTDAPTQAPTNAPVDNPTQAPTQAPTNAPVDNPTQAPTNAPADNPTQAPTSPANAAKPDPTKVTKLGDVDLNGFVELNDIVVLAKYLLNSKSNPLDEVQLANADVTKDGAVNVSDLSKIIEYNLNPAKTPIE